MGLPRPATLPNLVVIGGMKCGTSALHRYLDAHPDVVMSEPKELNFFIGEPRRRAGDDPLGGYGRGTWHRGARWYAERFDVRARVRGESSPGYTSPDHPYVAERMARLVPRARLVYLVRDPIARAVSQYRHHVADGTESRPLAEALLDDASQYLARSRYHERLAPFLERFPRAQVAVVASEELRARRRQTLRRLFGFLDVPDDFWGESFAHPWHTATGPCPHVPPGLNARLVEALRADADRLRETSRQEFPGWSV